MNNDMQEPEIKQEFDINNHLQCRACLSFGRRLVPLGNYLEIYRKLLSNIDNNYDTVQAKQIQVCWECQALLRRAEMFQRTVQKAYEVLNTGQVYSYGSLSNLTTIVLSDAHPHTIYVDHEMSTLTEIPKSENVQDLGYEEFCNEDFLDATENMSQEIYMKNEIKCTEKKTKSKTVNKWAQKRAKQNKKPKFRILTNKDIKKITRIEKIGLMVLQNYLQEKKCSELYMNMRYKCESCVKGFKDKNNYSKHCSKYHNANKGPYTCDVCSSTFKNKRHLAVHVNNHFNKYVCLVCGDQSYCAESRKVHVEGHRRVFQCLKCELIFSTRRELYQHYKEWHERFVCDVCGISFKMRYCIRDHIRKQHSPFECVPCNKRFARYNGLWLHNKTHHTATSSGSDAYCVECDKHYPDIYRYRWHLANSARHKPRKKTRVPCPGCDKVFSKNIYMKDHFNLVHLKCIKYRCDDCNKNFIRNADLVKHRRRVHEGQLPPRNKICYMCGKGFTTNKILANHIRTHTGERPYACSLCPARFAQSAALAGHTRALHRHI
ncbi:hypothetical protein O0L34_g10759 [Tuta absoluta]|nr:hypothetical protein O0L34_g10759 [Tuta absoluta]